jgi:tetratricopeptide (TPR) repeat protein
MRYTRTMSNEADWAAVEEATELLVEGRHSEALTELSEVLRADPSNAYAYHYLGLALYELDQLQAARDAHRAAVRLRPDYLASRVALSHSLRRLGALDEAIDEAREALKRFVDDGDALHAAALALAARGDRQRARAHLERFLSTGPEVEAALEARGLISLLEGGPEGEPLELP